MVRRINKRLDRDALLELIETKTLIERIQQNFKGELDEPLTQVQLNGAMFLLKRTLPEVRITEGSVDHTFNGDVTTITNAALITELLDRKSASDTGRESKRTH